jgi:hypothetical protein
LSHQQVVLEYSTFKIPQEPLFSLSAAAAMLVLEQHNLLLMEDSQLQELNLTYSSTLQVMAVILDSQPIPLKES